MDKNSKKIKKDKSGISTRLIIQIIFLAVTILIGIRHILPGESSRGGAFDVFCPFGAIETLWSYLGTGKTLLTTSPLNFAILFGVLGVSLLAGRAFCGWMCPIGTLQDFLANLAHKLNKNNNKHKGANSVSLPFRISEKNNRWLRSFKYLVLGIILLASTCSCLSTSAGNMSGTGYFQFPTDYSAFVERIDYFYYYITGKPTFLVQVPLSAWSRFSSI